MRLKQNLLLPAFVVAMTAGASACALNLEEARATARIAEEPPVDLNVASCNGLTLTECGADLSEQFAQISSFWTAQSQRWTQQGLLEEQEGQEIIMLSRKIAAMAGEASVYFKDADPQQPEKIKAKFAHFSAVYTNDRHKISSLAEARLRLRNASATEINARRSRIREALRHMGNQPNGEVDVHVHQD